MLEDDLDIYDDLDDFQETEDKKSKELLALEEKYKAAEVEIEGLKAQNNKLQKQIKQMEVNLQNLLDTAKAEVKRKETLIAELRKEKDDICFRRKRGRDVEDSAREAGFSQKRPKPDKPEKSTVAMENVFPVHKRNTEDELRKSNTAVESAPQVKGIEKPAKSSNRNNDAKAKRKSHSPSPAHKRNIEDELRKSNTAVESAPQVKGIEKPAKSSNRNNDAKAKRKSHSPSPAHKRNIEDELRKSNTAVESTPQVKGIEKPAKSSSRNIDSTTKRKSHSPSPGHSRKSSTQYRSTDGRNREREREKERDRERDRGRRHERERRRSRSPRRSQQDERHRNRISNEKQNQSRRRSSSRSRQRTASSGPSREQSLNKLKTETIKTLFGEETNDQDDDFKPKTEEVMQDEMKLKVESLPLIAPENHPLRTELKNAKNTHRELKPIEPINKHLLTPISLEPSKARKIEENPKAENSNFSLTIKSVEMPQIPGLDLIASEDKPKEQCKDRLTSETSRTTKVEENPKADNCNLSLATKLVEMPQIPGLDLIASEEKVKEQYQMQIIESKCKERRTSEQMNVDSKQHDEETDTPNFFRDHVKKKDKSHQDVFSIEPRIPLETEKTEKMEASDVKDSKEDLNDRKKRNGKPETLREKSVVLEKEQSFFPFDVKVPNEDTTSGHTKCNRIDQTPKEISTELTRTESNITIDDKVLKEQDLCPKKGNRKAETLNEIVIEPEEKDVVAPIHVKAGKEHSIDRKKQVEKYQTPKETVTESAKTEAELTNDLKVIKKDVLGHEKQNIKLETCSEISFETKRKEADLLPDPKVSKNDPKEIDKTLSEILYTAIFSKATDNTNKQSFSTTQESAGSIISCHKKEASVLLSKNNIDSATHKPPAENQDIHYSMETRDGEHEILQAGQITPTRKAKEEEHACELADEDKPTPKRPSPVKKIKSRMPSISIGIDQGDSTATTKTSIQIIEDIRLPIMMDIEHIADRVDGVEENVEIPLSSSTKALPMSKPSNIMYAQPDSTKIDHNDHEMILEVAINALTGTEEKQHHQQGDQLEQQLNENFSIEMDTLDSALEQLHQTSPDESIVTSTSTKALQNSSAKQDLIKILSRSPNHESPIKLMKSEVEKATEKTPLKKRKINMTENLEVTPKTLASPTQEPATAQGHVTIDETLNLSGSFNSDSSIVTKRCSLGQSDYQFERVNDEVILRVTRRGRRRRPPNPVEIKLN